MKRHRSGSIACLVFGLLSIVPWAAQAQVAGGGGKLDLRAIRPGDRISGAIDDQFTVLKPGNRHPLTRAQYDVGIAPPDHRLDRMVLVLENDDAQQRALESLLEAQQDPQSPYYHQWLTPEEFGQKFGVSDHDLNQVVVWLERHGFQVEPIPAGRRAIVFSGTAAEVQGAFHTEIHMYEIAGERHYANATDPAIPAALASVVQGVATLHDFRAVPMHLGMRPLAEPSPQYSSGSTHYMAPVDFATIYDTASLYSNSIDGTGQSIAIAGRTNFKTSDVATFRSSFGLPANAPTVIVNGTNPGIVSQDEQGEAELDVEWSGAVAKNASIQFVLSGSTQTTDGILLSSQYIVNHNVAPVMSLSFGLCEAAMGVSQNQVWNSLWQQAAAEGISVFVSSGDSGAAGCDSPSETQATSGAAINGLCSSPYSTCVGGTQFNDSSNYSQYWSPTTNPATYGSALSYIPEAVWNESGNASGGSDLWAGGGGASIIYSKPSWQTGPGVPADGHRDVPDVSLTAAIHDAYLFCLNGSLYLVGGTSASSPSFAGITAMVVQQTGQRQGNVNSKLYGLATNQSNGGAAVFHDTTLGNNSVPGLTGFSAGSGYDAATGLGSVDAFTLVNHWSDSSNNPPPPPPPTPAFQLTASASALTMSPGTSSTVQVNVTVSGGFNSAVTLSLNGLPVGWTGTYSPVRFNAPGSGSSILTLKTPTNAANGSHNLTIAASGGGISHTLPLSVTVQAKCKFTISPTSVSPTYLGGKFTATVTTTTGCTWTASTSFSWITVTSGASGSGSGRVNYSVASNTATSARTGALSIAGLSLPVKQSAAPQAGPSLTPPSIAFTSNGGNGSITLTMPQSTKAWVASTTAKWITLTSPASGKGSTTLSYNVGSNVGAATRSAVITVAGLSFTVSQGGTSCSYNVNMGGLSSVSGGFNGSAVVSTQAACPWSAVSNASWISVTSAPSVKGAGTAGFFVTGNSTSAPRTGTLNVAGYTIQVTEAANGNIDIKAIK